MKPRLTVTLVPVGQITVRPEFDRWGDAKTDDDILKRSIEKGGVQQPVILLRIGDTLQIVKGSRRLGAAKALGMPKVPAVVDVVPDGQDPESYHRRLRFILDEHRQDLLPSQRAELIVRLQEQLHLTSGQVSVYLGVDSDSITNWLAVRRYVPEIVAAMDAGALTMQAARVFNGMSEEGQRHIWKKHQKELTIERKSGVPKAIRAMYPPVEFPKYYANPGAKPRTKTARSAARRKPKVRQAFTPDEKRRLMHSVDLKEEELAELKEEAKELKADCIAAGPVVAAILRTPKLRKLVPEPVADEFEAFSASY